MIKCCLCKEQQNIEAVFYESEVYHQVCKDIEIGDELLVWYGDEYQQHNAEKRKQYVNEPLITGAFHRMIDVAKLEGIHCTDIKENSGGLFLKDFAAKRFSEDILASLKEKPTHLPPKIMKVSSTIVLSPKEKFMQNTINAIRIDGCYESLNKSSHSREAEIKSNEISSLDQDVMKDNSNENLNVLTTSVVGDTVEPSIALLSQVNDVRLNTKHRNQDRIKGEKICKCPDCEKTYTSYRALQRHAKNIHNKIMENPLDSLEYERHGIGCHEVYACLKCDQTFAKLKYLRTHHLKVHSTTPKRIRSKRFGCRECSISFAKPDLLKEHQNLYHPTLFILTTDNKFKCTECLQVFTNPVLFNCHRCLYTGKELYKCDDCSKVFMSLKSLISHQTLSLHEGMELLQSCDLCGNTCLTIEDLTTHLKTHTKPVEKKQKHRSVHKFQRRKTSS